MNCTDFYLYNEEKCQELDTLLKKIAESDALYSIYIGDTNDSNVGNVHILFQNGLIVDTPNLIPNSNSSVKYYKLSSPCNLGSEFYRNGGFLGERKRNVQLLKDKKIDMKIRIWAIVASLIGGGLMGTIVNIIFQIMNNKCG
jgi:hypothetical protein